MLRLQQVLERLAEVLHGFLQQPFDMLAALLALTVEEDDQCHGAACKPVSQECRNNVTASRSAQPPGLRLRATKRR